MRRDVVAETGRAHDISKRLVHALHRITVPLHRKPLSAPFPAPEMCQELIRQGNGRLAFLRLTPARGAAVEHATVKIDPAMADGSLQGGAAHRARPRAGIECD